MCECLQNSQRSQVNLETSNCVNWNDKFFDTWTRESSYVIGLLAADGHVEVDYKLRAKASAQISLGLNDVKLVEQVATLLESSKQLNMITEKHGRLDLISPYAVSRLKDLGFIQRKSFENYHIEIPDEFFWHFLRGFTDGDGRISFSESRNYLEFYWNISANSSSKRFFEYLQNKLKEKLIPNSIKYYEHTTTYGCAIRLRANGKKANRLCEFLYQDSNNLRMDRKYNTYMEYRYRLSKNGAVPTNEWDVNNTEVLHERKICSSVNVFTGFPGRTGSYGADA